MSVQIYRFVAFYSNLINFFKTNFFNSYRHRAYHCLHYALFIYAPSLPCNTSSQTRYANSVIKACLFVYIIDQN